MNVGYRNESHSKYIDVVKLMAEVIHRPAIPEEAKPDSANNVVTRTASPPRASKFNRSHRFVIQKLV
jgi:hypothetical protein